MSKKRITAVVACAGEGIRFGAPYPKELHAVSPGVCILDLALSPIMSLRKHGFTIRIVAVAKPERSATIERLGRLGDQAEVVVTFQHGIHGDGLAGAWRAAEPFTVGPSILVLADQFFQHPQLNHPVIGLLDHLEERPIAVLAARTEDPSILSSDGALAIEGDPLSVVAAAEKPSITDHCNAVWASVACRPDAYGELYSVFSGESCSPLIGAPAVIVDGYRNVSRPDQL